LPIGRVQVALAFAGIVVAAERNWSSSRSSEQAVPGRARARVCYGDLGNVGT
jgi:hypothetical protein